MKTHFVLDAWAILALLQKEEPAATCVKDLLRAAQAKETHLTISSINLGEVIYRVGKTMGEQAAWETLDELRRLPLNVLPAQEEAVWAAVTWKMRHPISYADAFAVATAEKLKATLLTGDPELTQLADEVQVEPLTHLCR